MKKGTRVELVYTIDKWTSLKEGDRCTVAFIDDIGTVFVDWDNGSSLGLIPGTDSWKVVKD